MTIAILFPGQGSQSVGMGKELAEKYPVAKKTFDEADAALGYKISQLCFEGPDSELKLTANAQPALLVTSMAAWRVFSSETSSRPFVSLGHSLGEYSALAAADGFKFTDAVETVRLRGFAMQEALVALAMIVQRFRPRLLAGAHVQPVARITLRPARGLPMRIERRR